MRSTDQAILVEKFRDNPAGISIYLTDIFKENDIDKARLALSLVLRAQNVQILARDAGLRRDALYRTFGGRIDPQFGRTVKVLEALGVRATAVPPASPIDVRRLRSGDFDAQDAGIRRLNQALARNDSDEIAFGLREIALSQNVTTLAQALGIMRTTVYKTYGGVVDPQLGRVLRLFAVLDLRLEFIAQPRKVKHPRPKLGRPSKARAIE